MKRQFTLAACIRAERCNSRQSLNWRNRDFTCIYDFGWIPDPTLCRPYLRQMETAGPSIRNHCIRLMIDDGTDLDRLVAEKTVLKAGTLILALPRRQISLAMITQARRIAGRVFVEVYTEDMVQRSIPFKPDGFVIRGNEAGGICSNTSNPALLRSIRKKTSMPIWIYGGIGPQSALAYAIGGADGVILSDSLLLIPELAEDLGKPDRKALQTGIRTQTIDIGSGLHIRVWESYGKIIHQIKNLSAAHDRTRFEAQDNTDTRLSDVLAMMKRHTAATRCFMGEEVAWASEFGRRYATLPDLMQDLERQMVDNYAAVKKNFPLARGNALARELRTEFPILQGPMTHVSDAPDFLAHVARNGAIPFAALALSKGEKLEALLRETQKKVAGKPWGVGILGFAPQALQEEQLARVEKYRPDLAIIAGGRPSHYQTLRGMGVVPFLHTPVPSMIAPFFKEGVRHFIFEGRGCGGHIGPINSFTLWQSALVAFQQLAAEGEDLSDVRIAFAGGIYDALSAAMTSAFCAPLLEQGAQFGFIVGTAYLFTREILESAAITPAFQRVALNSDRTVILETRPGHAIRCAPTSLTSEYCREKADLLRQGMAPAEVHERLEELHIGRLRLAAKGVKRAGVSHGCEELVAVAEADQIKEGLFMIGEAAALLDHVLAMGDLHRSLCCDAVRALGGNHPKLSFTRMPGQPVVKSKPTDIAIIGMSILAPGSENLDTFWHNILAQLGCIDQVPEDRWRPSVNFHPDPDHPDTAYSTRGGFLGDIPINCMEYGIPPGSVPHIEPAQLLALEAVKQALMDAGYEKKAFDRTRTSVFFGFAGGGDLLLAYTVRAALKEYMSRVADIPDTIREGVIRSLNEVLPQWTEDSFPGILGNVIAGRVANRFNLNGLNFTVDAACASSMAALQVACQDLAYGVTRTAIVGGVDASQHMFGYTCFSKSKALSRNGRSTPFSDAADGIVLGEGVGVVVLKRLADAIDDADRIYAVIKGIGGSSDGKGSGLTVPRSHGQKLAIERACEVAGFNTDTVDLIEAHGTGTPLGDRVELETIHDILQNHGAAQPCAIGSIKSAIGHTKGAAGVIGVIKTALALHHKILPAHINTGTVHPAVACPKTRLYLNTQTRPWLRKSAQRPRRAGVSAFGFGGTNFHTILEEYGNDAHDPAVLPHSIWPAELFLFSSHDVPALVNGIDAAIASLENTDASLAEAAYGHYLGQVPSDGMPVRIAVKAHSLEELKKKLLQCKALIAGGALRSGEQTTKSAPTMADGIWGSLADAPAGPLTALFPGQGSQKLHMLRDLAVVFPIVRACLEHGNSVLADEFFPLEHGVLTDYIYPPDHQNPEEKKQALNALTQTPVAQPALAVVEMALFYLLAEFNIQTAMAAGHSFGELTALWSAGVMADRQLLTLACERGRCLAAASKVPTGMAAVHVDRNALAEFIDASPELTLANHNTPRQVVVSGTIEALEHLAAHCRKQKWGCTRLPVSQGFHSPHMASAGKQWHQVLTRRHFLAPRFPVYSNVTAEPYGRSAADISGLLAQHLQNGVAFVEQIQAMYAAGARTFLEIGPGAVLTNFVAAILSERPHHALAVQPRENASGTEMLLDCLAALHACGYPVDLRPAYACRRVKTKGNTNPQPSATLFLVNGGKSKPTVTLKPGKNRRTNPSVRDSAGPSSLYCSGSAPIPHSPDKPSLGAAALELAPAESTADPGAPRRSSRKMTAAAQSVFNNQEKLQQLKHFQKSMRLFLETQERFQKQRLEMMEKMWKVNQQLVQNLLGSGHAVNMPATTGIASNTETEKYSPKDHELPDDAVPSSTRQTPPDSSNGYFPANAPLGAVGPDPDGLSRPSEEMVQKAPADYRSLLFEIIAERTQYPVEMLAPDQEIEADLGIDSIKRVEIITMLRDAHPSLGDIADEKYYEDMAQMKTLGDIVTWIDRTFGPPPWDIHLEKTHPPAASQAPAATAAFAQTDCRSLLFEVISERTQYPVEMLALDQDIEADLGIDSIKRVEIVTMLRDLHPLLSDIADEKYYEEIAQLKTLGDVVAWIDRTFGKPEPHSRQPSDLPADEAEPDRKTTLPAGKLNDSQKVMVLISEKTRYPVELIDMDLELEKDLGLDTDQLIDIMTNLINRHPLFAQISPGRLRRCAQRFKTVQDLARWKERALESIVDDAPSGADAAPDMPVKDEQTETPVFRRYALKLIEQPLDANPTGSPSGVLMLLDGGHPLGKQVQADAEKRGIRCVRVMHGDHDVAGNQNGIRFTADQEKDYETCYQRVKTSHGIPCGVLNLLSLGKHSHEECYQAVLQSFLWAKTMGADPDLRQDNRWKLFWISVTGMGGDFGLNPSMDFEATQNGLHGITKCLYHEWPGLRAKTVDIHPKENPVQLSRFVLDECFDIHDTVKEIGFLNQRRHALLLTDQPHECSDIQPRLNSDSVLLITGGAKGITAEAAFLLAKQYQPTMVLLGRTPLPERSPDELEAFIHRALLGENDPKSLKSRIIKELMPSTDHVTPALVNDRYAAIMNEYKIRQNLEKMKRFNAKVFYHACDCTNDHEFSGRIRQIYKTFHRIDGVIHGAGCLKDALIAQKTLAHFKKVVDTKVEGARILLRELDFEKLEIIAFFSSVAGRFGNRGQSDYAAANEILNKIAARIDGRWPGKAVAINWGPWEGDGMVSSRLKEQFMKAGVHLLPRDLGAQMVDREINASNRTPEVVIFGATDIENRLPLAPPETSLADFRQRLPFPQLFESRSGPPGSSFSWELELDRTAPYLNDHRINGVPVLAAAMAMEIMAQAGLAAVPGYGFKGFQKFELHKGIRIATDLPVGLMVAVDVNQNGAPDDLIADVRLTLPNQRNRSNYACRVLLGKTRNDPVPEPLRVTHSRLFGHSVEKVYQSRLFHKGVFRALKHVDSYEITDLKNSGIKGMIEPSAPEHVIGKGAGGVWLIDPIVFDGAYQLALLWVQERYGVMALPAGVGQYRRYRSYNGGPVHCAVAIKNDDFPRLLMDFIFTDAHGDLCARATDVAALMSRGLIEPLSAPRCELATVPS